MKNDCLRLELANSHWKNEINERQLLGTVKLHVYTLADEQNKALKSKMKKFYNDFQDNADPGFLEFWTSCAISQQPVVAPEKWNQFLARHSLGNVLLAGELRGMLLREMRNKLKQGPKSSKSAFT